MQHNRSTTRPFVLTPGRARPRRIGTRLVIALTDLVPFLLVAALVILSAIAIALTR